MTTLKKCRIPRFLSLPVKDQEPWDETGEERPKGRVTGTETTKGELYLCVDGTLLRSKGKRTEKPLGNSFGDVS